MLKKIALLIVLFVSLFVFTGNVYAKGDFDVEANVSYEVRDTGITHVTHKIYLKNNKSEVHAEAFVLALQNIKPENIKAYDEGGEVETQLDESLAGSKITVKFENAIVGIDKSRNFTIEFDDKSFAVRTGEVWEISIPRFRNDSTFDKYDITLSVPETFGNEAYLSPVPVTRNIEDAKYIYTFSTEEVEKSGISAGFGKFQVFAFSLSYHLENPLNKTTKIQVALPPDNSIQRVHYDEIIPKPSNISLDTDSNWIAEYEMSPRQRIDVTAKGRVEIIAVPRPYINVSPQTLEANLAPTEFWPSDDPEIIKLAKSLGTPEAIYKYVVNTLHYDYGRAKPNVERLGAKKALQNPNSAICTEFTDLFITLSRAAGIPAREVNGYAYTENPDIEPISLVADVLHAWPEYWNEEARTWIPVDPTWGATTQGVDYFNKLDLRHFAFVMHGVSDTKPFAPGSYKLGPNPQKDVYVSFGQLPVDRTNKLQVTAKRNTTLPLVPGKVHVVITNSGPRAEYNLTPKVGYDNTTLENKFVEIMPPYSTYEFDVSVPYNFFGKGVPEFLTLSANNLELKISTFKDLQVILNMTFSSLVLIFIILLLLARTRKIRRK